MASSLNCSDGWGGFVFPSVLPLSRDLMLDFARSAKAGRCQAHYLDVAELTRPRADERKGDEVTSMQR